MLQLLEVLPYFLLLGLEQRFLLKGVILEDLTVGKSRVGVVTVCAGDKLRAISDCLTLDL